MFSTVASASAAAELRMSNFTAQGLANTAWAFAKVGQSDSQLFMAVARAAELEMSNFDMQHLANTA